MAKGMLNCENSSKTAGYCCRERSSLEVSAKYKSRSVHGALTAAVSLGAPKQRKSSSCLAGATQPHSLSHLEPHLDSATKSEHAFYLHHPAINLKVKQSRTCSSIKISSAKKKDRCIKSNW